MNSATEKPAAGFSFAQGSASYRPFLWAAIVWALLGAGATLFWTPQEDALHAMGWLAVLYGVSVADLYAIARLVGGVLELLAATPEKRIPGIIQTSYWGILKLACLGIFTVLVFKGHEIPVTALLTGVGTMVFVPLVGGFWWSKSLQ